MGMLPGWEAQSDAAGLWTFHRDGRDGSVEVYPYHPIIFAVLESVPPSSQYDLETYPIIRGTWYPCRDVLTWFSDHMYRDW